MCGITGIISINGKLTAGASSTVQRMNAALQHRGPDDEGSFQDNYCALAMMRLSIIDLESGSQPIFNETKEILVFQNGEIYNFRALKNQLQNKGHQFRTESDTEVLVHLYEEYKEEMFSLLKGMFAICLYDKKDKVFLLARDRFGEKPLYYHAENEQLSFSSEIASLLQNNSIKRELNEEALPYYFRTSLVPDPITMFKGVYSLKPGSFMKIKEGKIAFKNYFTLDYQVDNGIKTINDAIDLIKPNLIDAVKQQTVSDVPIGAFLSGGIDSSTIVSILQQNSSKPINTYTVKFEDEDYDESKIAKKVAQHCGTNHQEIVVPNYQFNESIFYEIIDHVGLPFRDSSAIPTWLISKKIRENVKVAISGDGGDELFGGYDLFKWYLKILMVKNLPPTTRKIVAGTFDQLQKMNVFKSNSRIRQINRALTTAAQDENEIPISLNELFTSAEMEKLLPGISKNAATPYELLKKYPDSAKNWSNLRKIMFYRTKHTLPGNMLVKVDRMSMANSLEVRAPFLDPDLFEAAAKLPDKFLINKGLGKYLIREMMKNELPKEVFSHPKKGFSIPLHKYQNNEFQKLAKHLLFEKNKFSKLFPKEQLESIFHQGMEMKKDTNKISVFRASHQLWMMMQLFGWAERFDVSLND